MRAGTRARRHAGRPAAAHPRPGAPVQSAAPMSAPTTSVQPGLSLPCWLERHGAAIKTPARKAAWHADCPDPIRCSCPGHARAQPADAQR